MMMPQEPDADLLEVEDAPDIPSDKRPVLGLFPTLWQAFSPIMTSPSFAKSDALKPAVIFALLTAVPLAFLQGIIPWTHTLTFTHVFHYRRIGDPTGSEILMDIARAGGIGCLDSLGTYALLAASYVSLTKAFGTKRRGATADPERAALRAVLYRAWLAPMLAGLGLPAMLFMWALPEDAGEAAVYGLLIISTLPFLMLFISLRSAARQSAGCGPLASFTVVLIPFVLKMAATMVLIGEPPGTGLLDPWLPDPPESAETALE